MSILIKGMEMPTDCSHCFAAAIGYDSPLYSSCKLYCRAVDKFADCATVVTEAKTLGMLREYQGRPDWCPLVEVKTPHGRLTDADALYEVAKTRSMGIYGPCNYQCVITGNDILKASTIVPAEGVTE